MTVVQLDGHIEILSGFAFDSARFATTGDVPVIRIRDVVRGRTETYFTGDYDPRYLVDEGDLLIGMDGDFNRATWRSGPALLNQRVCKVTGNPDTLDRRYLYHFLPIGLGKIWDRTSFATVKHLSVKGIRGMKVPLPSLDEQRRIAAILDKADELRAKRRETLAHLDTLTQSIFYDMFGDPLKPNSGVNIARIDQILSRKLQSGAYFEKSQYSSQGTEMVHMGDVFDGQVSRGALRTVVASQNEVDKYGVTHEDILIARRSLTYAGAAKSCLVPPSNNPLLFESSLIRLRPNPQVATPLFCHTYLNDPRVREKHIVPLITVATISGINQSNLGSVKIPLPPVEEQREFAMRISAVERLKEHHRTQLAHLDTLFASLQHRAFKGEL